MTKPQAAKGVTGCLLRDFNAQSPMVFRVYHTGGEFTDYDLLHSDLRVTIDDEDAYFYATKSGTTYLDHSPATLGIDDGEQ